MDALEYLPGSGAGRPCLCGSVAWSPAQRSTFRLGVAGDGTAPLPVVCLSAQQLLSVHRAGPSAFGGRTRSSLAPTPPRRGRGAAAGSVDSGIALLRVGRSPLVRI